MQLNHNELEHYLKQALPLPFYAVYGEESLLLNEASQAIREMLRQHGYHEREVFEVNAVFCWSQWLMACRSPSLLSKGKLLELHIPNVKLATLAMQQLVDYLRSPAAHVAMLLHLPKLDKKQRQSATFVHLQKAGAVIACPRITRQALPGWIRQRLRQQQQQIDDDALAFLANQVEGNLLAAQQEIEKLALLFGAESISLSTMQTALADMARYDIFQLSEALLNANPHRFIRILQRFQQNDEAPHLVLWSLTDTIRTLLRFICGQEAGKRQMDLYKTLQLWGDRQRHIEQAAKRLPKKQLELALIQAAYIDRLIKGAARGDYWQPLLQLGLSLMGYRFLPTKSLNVQP